MNHGFLLMDNSYYEICLQVTMIHVLVHLSSWTGYLF